MASFWLEHCAVIILTLYNIYYYEEDFEQNPGLVLISSCQSYNKLNRFPTMTGYSTLYTKWNRSTVCCSLRKLYIISTITLTQLWLGIIPALLQPSSHQVLQPWHSIALMLHLFLDFIFGEGVFNALALCMTSTGTPHTHFLSFNEALFLYLEFWVAPAKVFLNLLVLQHNSSTAAHSLLWYLHEELQHLCNQPILLGKGHPGLGVFLAFDLAQASNASLDVIIEDFLTSFKDFFLLTAQLLILHFTKLL